MFFCFIFLKRVKNQLYYLNLLRKDMQYSLTDIKDFKKFNAHVWDMYSLITLVPLFVLSIYKLMYPINIHKYNDRNPFPHLLQDKIARIFLFWAPIYYIVDMICMLLLGKLDSCTVSYFSHHIVSVIFLPSVIFQNHYPWFLCFVPCLHACLLVFPSVFGLDYIYLIACVLYHYGLHQEPFKNMKSYRFLQTGTWILEVTLAMLWYFGCKDDI